MASIFGVSVTTYGNWERGDKEPDIATIGCICRELGVSADWLLGLSDRRAPVRDGFPTAGLRSAEQPTPTDAYAVPCPLCAQKDQTIEALRDTVAALKTALRVPDAAGFPVPPSRP